MSKAARDASPTTAPGIFLVRQEQHQVSRGVAYLRMDRIISAATAAKIMALLEEDKSDDPAP